LSSHGFELGRPSDVFAVKSSMFEAPVKDPDESVRDGAKRLMMRLSPRSMRVVTAATTR